MSESESPEGRDAPEAIAVSHLRKTFGGVMAVDDSAAHDLAAACLKADIGVPDHVAIIGVNNDDLLCDSAWPPLTAWIATTAAWATSPLGYSTGC